MKLKRIEITGFKSFIERTALVFDAGVSGIVGPNGCGKSNVVDAIRWVMGEQNARNLRGRAMEDIIFGGSESRRPLGMAEVSLVLDNTSGLAPAAFRDYAEIQVTRRLFRNGDSEYLLNRTPCRLLDITELFMDTGVGTRAYSIIEQGKIGLIINAKPEERRSIIEEAAGVTKFKARKKAALRKIEATRQNLLRLGDIIAEVRRQMTSLKRQAQRAERFREHREELRGIELQFALRQYADFATRTETLGTSLRLQESGAAVLEAEVSRAELELDQVRLEHVEREKQTAAGQEKVFHLGSDIQKLEGRLELTVREIETLERERQRLSAEQADVATRLAAGEQESVALEAGKVDRLRDLEREAAQLAEAELRQAELSSRETAFNQQLEEARNRLYHLLTHLTRLTSQQEESARRLQALADLTQRNRQDALAVRDQFESSQARSLAMTDQLVGLKGSRDHLQTERVRLQEDLASLRRQTEEAENLLLVRREELSRHRSRLESLEQLERNLDGYGRGVRTLLADAAQRGRVRGLLADALDVPAEYEVAVEAALGERLQTLLTGSVADARLALDFLRQGEGRCTFLLPEFPTPPRPAFAAGRSLAGLVAPRAEDGELVCALLGGTYLVDDLSTYFRAGLPDGVTLVTAEGDLLTHLGELTGGGKRTLDQGLLHKKREMKELAAQVRRLDKEVGDLQTRREQLRRDALAAEEGLRAAEGALHQQEIRLLDHQKDQTGLQQELQRLQERLEVLSFEEDQLHEEEESLLRSRQEAEAGRTAGESDRVIQEAGLAELQAAAQELRGQMETVRQLVTSRKVILAGLQEREESSRTHAERLQRLAEELAARREGLSREFVAAGERQTALHGEVQGLRQELERLLTGHREAEAALGQLRERFEETRQAIDQREAALKEQRARAARAREELAARQLSSRELELEREHLRQTFLERYRIDLDDEAARGFIEPEFDPTAAGGRREALQRKIDEIGEVNLTAIDEFREMEERHTFLATQQDDLQRSLDGLQAAITKINRTTRRRFRETFDQVNARFREVFPRLFNGGQAELRLTDEEDLLETGIDIVAQPPGKKLQNVSLFSGGEKALTAVALIFAIFLIKPSPFCLLDEVDAPLDDANIGRFNELVAEMSALSQFIIITHNKRTMEIADTLYGITMEEPGVSKLVSVRMSEVA
ncbi:MAG: chromosome segregation protein SMC [Desulfuromonadales bacterium]|nr:chromosome segregation protein SMC [Desulfuromonadales bacterium]